MFTKHYMEISEDTFARMVKLLQEQQDDNIKLRNQLVDLMKDREALINQVEALKREKDNT